MFYYITFKCIHYILYVDMAVYYTCSKYTCTYSVCGSDSAWHSWSWSPSESWQSDTWRAGLVCSMCNCIRGAWLVASRKSEIHSSHLKPGLVFLHPVELWNCFPPKTTGGLCDSPGVRVVKEVSQWIPTSTHRSNSLVFTAFWEE